MVIRVKGVGKHDMVEGSVGVCVGESSRATYELGEEGYDGVKGCHEVKGSSW